jgi:hypothetical protein
MYKKITHNIVEEHFDHPIASQIKKTMERSTIPNSIIFDENKFKSDVNAYFTKYKAKINEMINSITGSEEALIVPFEELFDNAWIDGIGNITKPIYASELGERINSSMRNIPITLLIMIQILRTGRDISVLARRFPGAAQEMAAALSGFNPLHWNNQEIDTLFTTITSEITNQVKARLKKDSTAEMQAAQKVASAFAMFENTLVNGIITQHPERFSRVSTATISDNKDIM